MFHHVEIDVSNLARSVEFRGWFLAELGRVEHQRWILACLVAEVVYDDAVTARRPAEEAGNER
jgi:hypothetical protein